ncbi:hypothetical protein [Robertkochia solimangrovi]|uniref:hypothetical protein n=1 Tax=Robertkochia solimangrovi TaxID=2213046 RepID=UPI00117C7000|nr:hypothetical protein [Robertkochia solimangrovi]TRZ45290.1 hypothetical protein DMZ48_05970 [Robertkochia solimangrovi]
MSLQILPEPTFKTKLPDMSIVLEDCYGEIEYLNEIITLFKESIAEYVEQTAFFISSYDFTGIYMTSHKVKVGLELMRAFGLLELVLQMEQLSYYKENMGNIIKLFNLFVSEYPLVIRSIEMQQSRLQHNPVAC